jgi:hypothetical protein
MPCGRLFVKGQSGPGLEPARSALSPSTLLVPDEIALRLLISVVPLTANPGVISAVERLQRCVPSVPLKAMIREPSAPALGLDGVNSAAYKAS